MEEHSEPFKDTRTSPINQTEGASCLALHFHPRPPGASVKLTSMGSVLVSLSIIGIQRYTASGQGSFIQLSWLIAIDRPLRLQELVSSTK